MKTPLENTPEDNSPVIQNIQELAITIVAQGFNPSMLTMEFLKFSGVIPGDWELAKQPVANPRMVQFNFQNGLNIVAQTNTVTFAENVGPKELNAIVSATVARNFIDKLPRAEYQGLNISPKILVPLPGHPDNGRKYITETLIAPGPWRDFGKAPLQAGLNLFYQLSDCQLNLNINEAKIQLPNQTTIGGLLFNGSFNYQVTNEDEQNRLNLLKASLDKWQSNWESFQEIIYKRFLEGVQTQENQPQSVFPKM